MISNFGKFIMVMVVGIISAILGLYSFIAGFIPFKISFLQLNIGAMQWAALLIGIILIVFSAMYLDDAFMWTFIILGIITALPALGGVLAGFGILAFFKGLIPLIVFQLLLILDAIGFFVAIIHGTD